MSSVASMMSLTSTVSGGGLSEAAPGGLLLTRTGTQWTFTVDASVSVPTQGSGNTYLIPYSSNYCVAILAAGQNGDTTHYSDGGRGGNLAYNNGMTLAVGESFVVTLGTSSTVWSYLNFPGGSVTIAWAGNYNTTGTASQFTFRAGTSGGSGAGSHWSNQNNPGGGGGGAGHWTQSGGRGTSGGAGSSAGQGGAGTNPFNTSRPTASGSSGAQYGGGGGGGGYQGANHGYGYFGFFRLIYGLNRGFNVSNWDNSNNYTGGTADTQLT